MHKSFTQPTRITAVLAGLGLAASAAFSSIAQADDADLLAAAEKEGKVIIYSTTDTSAADPVLKGFNSKYPNIQVEYHDMNSTEIYNRFVSEQASGANSADMVWSSAMDSTMRSEEHTSELQSRGHLECRHLLEKKKVKCMQKAM